MNTILFTRRSLLRSASILPLVALVPACASLADANIQKVIDDATTIAAGVAAILPALGTINGISTATVATVGSVIADIQNVAGAVRSAVSTTAALPLVQRLGTGVGNVIAVLRGVSDLPASVQMILADAATLLPVVETAVGILVPHAPDGAAVDAARLRLKAAARRT